MTLSQISIEMTKLGFGGSVPDTIDGQAFHEMSMMVGYFNDAEEYLDPALIRRVEEFATAMLPAAKASSEETGLQNGMLEARVERALLDVKHWKKQLDAFDRGQPVNFEYPDGTPARPIEQRDSILGIIKAHQDVVDAGGKWW